MNNKIQRIANNDKASPSKNITLVISILKAACFYGLTFWSMIGHDNIMYPIIHML